MQSLIGSYPGQCKEKSHLLLISYFTLRPPPHILLSKNLNSSPLSPASNFHKPPPTFWKQEKGTLGLLPPPSMYSPAPFLLSTPKFLQLQLTTPSLSTTHCALNFLVIMFKSTFLVLSWIVYWTTPCGYLATISNSIRWKFNQNSLPTPDFPICITGNTPCLFEKYHI